MVAVAEANVFWVPFPLTLAAYPGRLFADVFHSLFFFFCLMIVRRSHGVFDYQGILPLAKRAMYIG